MDFACDRFCLLPVLCRWQRKGGRWKRNNAAVELGDSFAWRHLWMATSVRPLRDSVSCWRHMVPVWRTKVRSVLWVVADDDRWPRAWNGNWLLHGRRPRDTRMAYYRCVLTTSKVLISQCNDSDGCARQCRSVVRTTLINGKVWNSNSTSTISKMSEPIVTRILLRFDYALPTHMQNAYLGCSQLVVWVLATAMYCNLNCARCRAGRFGL